MRTVKLNELCLMKSGGTPSRKKPEFYNGLIPWAKISDLESSPDGFVYDTEEHITNDGLASINNRLFTSNTLFLAMYGSVGKTAISKVEMSTNQAILGINIKDQAELDLYYLQYWFRTIKQKLLNRAVGGTLQNISLTIVKDLEIPLPPLEEQKKIATILDAADDYRQKTKALVDKYDQLTQSLFLDMFGDSTNTERTELANTVTDKGHFVDGPFGSNLKVSDQTEKGIRLIQVNNIGVRVFRDKTSRFTSVEKYETLRKHEVIPGDLVVAKMGEPLGRCCILPNHISKALVVADCMRIRVSSPHFISKYVMFFLNSYDAKQQIKNLSRGSTRVRINLSMLRKLKIPKPTLSSQNQFAERVAQIEQQKQQAEASLVKAEELFSSLLQRAFKGELTS